MKKLLSSVLILTLSLNSFGANCSAASETSEKIKQINNNLAQIKNKTLSEANKENAIEKTQTEQKDDSESCENKASDSTAEAQKDATKPVNKSFREKQIEKLNKEIQNLEKTSDKKIFWKNFSLKILLPILTISVLSFVGFFLFSETFKDSDYSLYGLIYYKGYHRAEDNQFDVYQEILKYRELGKEEGYNEGYQQGKDDGYNEGKKDGYQQGKDDGYQKGKEVGYNEGKKDGLFEGFTKGKQEGIEEGLNLSSGSLEFFYNIKKIIKTILTTLHSDNFKRIKSFDDVKELYYAVNNFNDEYLKNL